MRRLAFAGVIFTGLLACGKVAETAPAERRDEWISGRILEPGYFFLGITTDDWLGVGRESPSPEVKLISLHSGATVPLPPLHMTAFRGPAVFLWTSTTSALQAWTHARGLQTLTGAGALGGAAFAAAEDGRMVFLDQGPTGGTLTFRRSDGTHVALGPAYDGCGGTFFFSGERLFTSYCRGKGGWTLSVIDKAGTEVLTMPGEGLDVSPRGDALLYAMGAAGQLLGPTDTTPTRVADGVLAGFLTPAGDGVVYVDNARSLRRASKGGGAPVEIAASIETVHFVSHDRKYVVYQPVPGTSVLTSTLAPGAPTALPSDMVTSTFTSDDRFFVYVRKTGEVVAQPTSGGAGRAIGADGIGLLAATGGKVVVHTKGHRLLVVDLGAGDAARPIADNVERLLLTSDGSHIAYAVSSGPLAGVFVSAL